ncbi:uncharacterized protein N7483_005873 [Penicillium malachiteum]|uniref:uncharacterized protein n=1 Tax=Penicillium malachiteum TaxID=1324776 RepID=UPI002547E8CE|nr:uncharacterized protein N7483_005873 [Penicillium malachiteum]KAJ5731365.1 hypothetical protein N7483_005873 [Penicillium malachiteum]
MAWQFFHCLLFQAISYSPIFLHHFIISAGYSRKSPYKVPQEIQILHVSSDSLIKMIRIYECALDTLPDSVGGTVDASGDSSTATYWTTTYVTSTDQTPEINFVDNIQCDFRHTNISNSQLSTHNGYTDYGLIISIQVSLDQENGLLEFIASYNGRVIGRKGVALSID